MTLYHVFFHAVISKIFAARVVSVMVGAIAFTRTVDASSAPNDFTSPSTPAFAVAILAMNGILILQLLC
jgi:hypothetical protein